MRVLHAPINIAGQASTIAHAQRKLGITSDVFVFSRNYFDYPTDKSLELSSKSTLKKVLLTANNFIVSFKNYDLFHFHFALSLLPWNIDLYLYKLLGKKVVMHYWGSDIIQTDLAQQYTLFTTDELHKIFKSIDNKGQRRKIKRHSRLCHQTIVGDYSLLTYSPQSIVIRQAIDLAPLPYIGNHKHADRIKIVHAPTNRDIKGTSHILLAITRLQNDGYSIDLNIVENKPHREAIEIYKHADIIIDDILQGPYGIFAIECMTLGKPVICYIRDRTPYGNLPIVSARPETIYRELKKLLDDQHLRVQLGKLGREYVEKNHDSMLIAKQLMTLYGKL